MKYLKHLFTALLLLCCVGTAKAVEVTINGIKYDVITDTKQATVISGGNYSGEIVVPSEITYNNVTCSVTSIGNSAFYSCKGLTSVTIPNSVTSIGDYAFQYCYGLTSVTIPNSVTSIGEWAFNRCDGLTSIEIPNSVTSIGMSAFLNCTSLTSITIPNSVTSIGEWAFAGCSGLTSIEIPNSVTSIENGAFLSCTSLTSITIPNSVTSIGDQAFEYCSGLTSVTIPNSVTSIGAQAFSDCTGLTNITIPNSVTSIEESAFAGCSELTSIVVDTGNAKYDSRDNCNAIIETESNTLITGCKNTIIPNSVTSIGEDAFDDCDGLTSITIPNSVTSIEWGAFNGCSSLTSVIIGNSVTSIGEWAFSGCYGLTSVTIPNSVTSIGEDAFNGCYGLTSVTIPNSVTSIGEDAFNGTAWYNNQPKGLLVLDDWLLGYKGDKPTDLIIPNNVKGIANNAFDGCSSLASVTIGNSVKSIGDWAFSDCDALTSITIPNSVTSIGEDAFYSCSGLTSVTIGNSASIGRFAFYDCTGLKTVINLSNLTFSKGSSSNGYVAYYADKVYNVPNGSTEGDFIFGKPNDVNTLLYYLGNTTELTLPADYKGENYAIGANVFNGNKTITSVEIPNSVTSIGSSAFYGCTGLKTVINFSNKTFSKGSSSNGYVAYYADKVYNVPNGSIEGDYIFGKPNNVNTLLYYLGNETELTLPADYNGENYAIAADVFKNNTSITSIEIPNSVTSIENSAFSGCTELAAVHINDIVAWCGIDFGSADANPLYYAGNLYLNGELLTELSIPSEVTTIKDYAFYNCKGVTNIDIIDGIKGIGNSAFYGCNNLETLYISNTIESIGDYAFANCNDILDIKIGAKKAITANENIFSSDVYNNACLYVPEGRKFAYEKTTPWNNFYIVETNFTGIDDVKEQTVENNVIYDLQGRVVDNPTKGVYIINGNKVLVK